MPNEDIGVLWAGETKSAAGKAGHKALEKVLAQANDTLAAVKHTADVLDDAERAAEAVERAKGSDNAQVRLSPPSSRLQLFQCIPA